MPCLDTRDMGRFFWVPWRKDTVRYRKCTVLGLGSNLHPLRAGFYGFYWWYITVMPYGRDSVSNHQPHECLLNRLFTRRSKKTSKLRVTGLCAGNSPGTGEFPAQMASNAENVSIWWRYHEIVLRKCMCCMSPLTSEFCRSMGTLFCLFHLWPADVSWRLSNNLIFKIPLVETPSKSQTGVELQAMQNYSHSIRQILPNPAHVETFWARSIVN